MMSEGSSEALLEVLVEVLSLEVVSLVALSLVALLAAKEVQDRRQSAAFGYPTTPAARSVIYRCVRARSRRCSHSPYARFERYHACS